MSEKRTWIAVVAGSSLVVIGAGALMDRIDYRLVMAGSSVLMALSFAYAQAVDVRTGWAAQPLVIGFAVAFGANIPMRSVLGAMMFGSRSLGSVLGILNGGTVGAGLTGPLMLGLIFTWQGSYSMGIWIMLVLSLALAVLPVIMRSRRELEEARDAVSRKR